MPGRPNRVRLKRSQMLRIDNAKAGQLLCLHNKSCFAVRFLSLRGRWKVLGFWIAIGVVFFCPFLFTPVNGDSHS